MKNFIVGVASATFLIFSGIDPTVFDWQLYSRNITRPEVKDK